MTKIMSKKQTAHLWHHIFDGHEARVKGLKTVREDGLITKEEYNEYLERASDELIYKIKEFKLREKLVAWVFILLFPLLQVLDGTDDMARRLGRKGRKSGRSRNKNEYVTDLMPAMEG